MGRFIAVKPTEHHGWYIEDTWTGATVCDFYHLKGGSVDEFKDAETYAKTLARHLDTTIEA